MTTPIKVAWFVVVLAAGVGLGFGIGSVFGEDRTAAEDHHAATEVNPGRSASTETSGLPGGLMISRDGYTLAMARSTAPSGDDVPVTFTITGPDGDPLTAYDVVHEKPLHLIAVRRDFTGFQHVHPVLSSDGTWATELDLTAGQWRLFADFKARDAKALTLGADLAVAGSYRPETRVGEMRAAHLGDYTVTLSGKLAAGADAELSLAVEHDGQPVTDLQPYLGAYGHLVALRAGDLAYLHVHPDGTPGDGTTQPGPTVVFHATVPSAGTYQIFFDFKHQGSCPNRSVRRKHIANRL